MTSTIKSLQLFSIREAVVVVTAFGFLSKFAAKFFHPFGNPFPFLFLFHKHITCFGRLWRNIAPKRPECKRNGEEMGEIRQFKQKNGGG